MQHVPFRRTRALVDLEVLAQNIAALRNAVSADADLCCVVKANAYGHGSVPVALTCQQSGASMLAVAMAEEAVPLREAGVQIPILVLGPSNAAQLQLGVDLGLDLCVFTPAHLQLLRTIAAAEHKSARVHLKIDTGMGRIGLRRSAELDEMLAELRRSPSLEVAGVFSHFAGADEAQMAEATDRQEDAFEEYVAKIRAAGFTPVAHISNSAGLLFRPGSDRDMVRAGIALYGYPPEGSGRSPRLRPVMQVEAEISHVKDVPAHTGIGYGSTFVTDRPTRVATVQIGYGDGYPRLLSGNGVMIVRTSKGAAAAPILGRVCMDMTMLDVTDLPGVRAGDSAVALGSVDGVRFDAEDIANRCGTISYEILCGLTSRMPRVYEAALSSVHTDVHPVI